MANAMATENNKICGCCLELAVASGVNAQPGEGLYLRLGTAAGGITARLLKS